MKYKEAIIEEMKKLCEDPKVIFLGEGVIEKNAIYGTLPVPLERVIEYPVAENLIMGSAIGLALKGYKPMVIFQRMDFMTIAADAIINHLAMLPKICPQLKLPVVIRAIVGSQSEKFWCGYQHTKDLTHVFSPYITTVEVKPSCTTAFDAYREALKSDSPRLIIEYKDLYESDL